MRKDGIEFSYPLNLMGHIFQAFDISNPIQFHSSLERNYLCAQKNGFQFIKQK